MAPSEADVQSLVSHLRLLAHEGAPVWEVPVQATIVTERQTTVTGPWDPATCSSVLLVWLEAGLIGLYRYTNAERSATVDAAPDEAYMALSRYEAWEPGTPSLFFFVTDRGELAPDEEWRRAERPPLV